MPFSYAKLLRISILLTLIAGLAGGQPAPPTYRIDTVAGTWPLGDGGPAAQALLDGPRFLALDAQGTVVIADVLNQRLRKVTPDGKIASVDITWADSEQNHFVESVKLDRQGTMYVATQGAIFQLPANGKSIRVAGGGAKDPADGIKATDASFDDIYDFVLDASGNIVLVHRSGYRIWRVDASGLLRLVAGTGVSGFADGADARLCPIGTTRGIAVDAAGNLYLADTSNHRIRKITPSGAISTFAGNGKSGSSGDNGSAASASISAYGLAFNAAGELYVAENSAHIIRKIGADSIIRLVAGNRSAALPTDGLQATTVGIGGPIGLATDAAGNLYFADATYSLIRKVTPAGAINTFAGRLHYGGDGGQATSALMAPYYAVPAPDGSLLISDDQLCRIRKVAANGVITTLAGNGVCDDSNDGPITTATPLDGPEALAVDSQGRVYYADDYGRVRMIANGTLKTIAGDLDATTPGDGSAATKAALLSVYGMTFDTAGNLYIADAWDCRLRKITTDGIIHTVAGNGTCDSTGDGGQATSATVSPMDIAVDSKGVLYVTDGNSSRVRRIGTDGIITTIAGTTDGYSGDGGQATKAQLSAPRSIAVDAQGNLYIADAGNSVIRKVDTSGIITTIAGNPDKISGGDGGPATAAGLNYPMALRLDASGAAYIADYYNHLVRKLTMMPRFPVTGVLNGGSFQKNVAPGALISVFGGPFVVATAQVDTVPLSKKLGGMKVTVNGTPIPLVAMTAGQINAQLPYETAVGAATVAVSSDTETGASFSFNVQSAAPGMFLWGDNRAITVNQDGGLNTGSAPAPIGSWVTIYFTGQGQSDNPAPTGDLAPASPLVRPLGSVQVTVGGATAEVGYLGLTPGSIGLSQANIRIPSVAAGDQPLIITIGGSASAAATITVSPAAN